MEQPTQQPNQEEIKNKPPVKTNPSISSVQSRKFIAIVTIVAVILTVGGILLLEAMKPYSPLVPPIAPQTYPPALSPQSQTLDTSGWQTYRSDEFGFEVKYPPGGEITKTNYGPRIMLPHEEEGTNLRGKYLDISVDRPPPYTGSLSKTEEVLLGKNLFTKETRGGAAAGTANETDNYIINREGKEYILSFTLLIANLGNFDPSIRPRELNKEKESVIFEQILSTFQFTN